MPRQKIDPGELFPRAEFITPNGNDLLPENIKGKGFLTWRNRGKKDSVRYDIPVAISRKGIDLEGRSLYQDVNGVKVFQSFPPHFIFKGTLAQGLMRIGNSVPPFIYASNRPADQKSNV